MGGLPGRRSADHSQIVLPLVEDPAAHIGQIEAGRGHPLRHRPARHLRALPDRRPDRTRLQHRRARHQAADHHEKEQPVRRK